MYLIFLLYPKIYMYYMFKLQCYCKGRLNPYERIPLLGALSVTIPLLTRYR